MNCGVYPEINGFLHSNTDIRYCTKYKQQNAESQRTFGIYYVLYNLSQTNEGIFGMFSDTHVNRMNAIIVIGDISV